MRQGLLGCTRVLIPNRHRRDAGGLATPARRLALARHQRCPWRSHQSRSSWEAWKKPSAMVKETREDPGIPQAVNFVETSASQGQEAGKNSGFAVSLAPSC